jgi:hypothetical protein
MFRWNAYVGWKLVLNIYFTATTTNKIKITKFIASSYRRP